jgi:hypothetical protein
VTCPFAVSVEQGYHGSSMNVRGGGEL